MYDRNIYRLTDDVIVHLDTIMPSIADQFLIARYSGFVTSSAVTVYELAIKDVFFKFSSVKHLLLYNFTRSYFEKINGRIKIQNIRDDYVAKYGPKYVKRFDKNIELTNKTYLRRHRIDLKHSYDEFIKMRHNFVHEGVFPNYVTFGDVKNSYELGKLIIDCLSQTMNR